MDSPGRLLEERATPVGGRLLIVEDDPDVGDVLRDSLEAEYSIEVARRWKEAALRLATAEYDLVILDIELPDADGLSLLERIDELTRRPSVLMLTGRRTPEQMIEGLDRGADDYLTKPFDIAVVRARLRALYRRRVPAETNLRFADVEVDRIRNRAWRAGRELRLSPRELELLRFLISRAGEAVSREEILRGVWGIDFEPGTSVVEVTVSRLRAKLEPEGLPRLIETVRGFGLRLTVLPDSTEGQEPRAEALPRPEDAGLSES